MIAVRSAPGGGARCLLPGGRRNLLVRNRGGLARGRVTSGRPAQRQPAPCGHARSRNADARAPRRRRALAARRAGRPDAGDRGVRRSRPGAHRAGAADPGGGRHRARRVGSQRSRRPRWWSAGSARATARRAPPLEVPPDQTREVRFRSGPAGTYHYWASTIGAPVPFRELAGALVVDPAEGQAEPDRILVITEWTNLTPPPAGGDRHGRCAYRGVRRVQASPDVRDQRLVVAGDRAVRLRARAARPVACHQPQFAGPPDAPSRLLLRGGQPGQRPARFTVRRLAAAPRRDAAAAVRRHHDDDLGARACGKLAVPLPHHAPRVARAASRRCGAGTSRFRRSREPWQQR